MTDRNVKLRNYSPSTFTFLLATAISSISYAELVQSVRLGVDSRYLSEGRDNFNQLGLLTAEYVIEKQSLSLALWHGRSENNEFRESNLVLGKNTALSDSISIDLDYSYLVFSNPDGDDHELSLTANFGKETGLSARVGSVFSHQSSGFYHSAEFTYAFIPRDYGLIPFVGLGFNGGYVPGEHIGLDHYVVGTRAYWLMTPDLVLGSVIGKTTPVDRQAQDTLSDTFWAGASIAWSF